MATRAKHRFDVLSLLPPIRTLHQFWGNFQVGGDTPGSAALTRLVSLLR
jgi:hypothetical protein